MEELYPCPFCEGEAEIERMGTNRVSMVIVCTNCGCRLETNETSESEYLRWNTRYN